jgi:cobalt/nickel transport system permease protein
LTEVTRKRFSFVKIFFVVFFAVFWAVPAYAMHISEGILPFNWCLLWFLAAAPFVAFGLWRLKVMSAVDVAAKPLVGLIAAAVFIISAMPVPVPTAGTCSHPCGTGFAGILLGPGISVVVAAVALFMQAAFLGHGGFSTLGANILSMGIVGSFTGFFIFRAARFFRLPVLPAAFAAGILSDWATYAATSTELALGIRGGEPFGPLFLKILAAFIPTQLPLGILEGFMTAGMITLLNKKRPDILVKFRVLGKSGAAL